MSALPEPAPRQLPTRPVTVRNLLKAHDPDDEDDRSVAESLTGVPIAWIDRLLPTSPWRFLAVVIGIAAGTWLAGLALASNRLAYLTSHEWQIQPLVLAGHLVALRLFVTAGVNNFLEGTRHLGLTRDVAWSRVRHLLQPVAGLLSLAVAAPFCALDLWQLPTPGFREYLLVPEQGLTAVDGLMAAAWCAEWIINAYIWVLLVGFLVLTVQTVLKHPFVEPVDVVLVEKHFRPFLLISVQGATILVFFGLLNGLYVWYAQGDVSDYLGLGVTVVLLLTSFVPPWLLLRTRLEAQLRSEHKALGQKMIAMRHGQTAAPDQHSVEGLAQRVEEAVTMLRMSYLDRLRDELGKAEGRAVVMRLLVPTTTIVWKLVRPLIAGL